MVDGFGVRGERLHHGAGAVGGAGRAGNVAPATVVVLDLVQPVERLRQATGGADVAQGDHREGGRSRPAFPGAVVAAAVDQLADQVAAGKLARIEAGRPQGEDRPGEVAGAADLLVVGAEELDRVVAVAGDVEWVVAAGGEAEHRPAGGFGPRFVVGGGTEAAVAILDRDQPVAGPAHRRGRGGSGQQGQHGGEQ